MASPFEIRPAGEADARRCFGVFRRSLWDLMRRIGYRDPAAPDPDLDAQWEAYRPLFDHLGATCAQWWLAEDEGGELLGYARSIERDGLLELTELFVAPGARVAGVGRALLERAFPPGAGSHRSIIATLDAPAVALYLRFGVAHQATAVGLSGAPRGVALPDGYSCVPAAEDEVLAIEREVLGHARPPDVRYMLGDRPAVVVRHRGASVGYAFLPSARGYAGPVAARDPAHLPALLAVLESAAHEAGLEAVDLTVPLAAEPAVDWLLADRGFRLDPFYCLLLADGPWARLDRYLPFNPCLML